MFMMIKSLLLGFRQENAIRMSIINGRLDFWYPVCNFFLIKKKIKGLFGDYLYRLFCFYILKGNKNKNCLICRLQKKDMDIYI